MAIIKLSLSERRRLSAFIMCLFAAALCWVLVSLSDTYNFTAKQVLVFRNVPQKRAFVPLQSDTVEVTTQGDGWHKLFSKTYTAAEPVVIDLHTLDHHDIIILNSQLKQINSRRGKYKIISFNPDTLHFDFTKRSIKKIKVTPLLGLHYEQGFAQSGKIDVKPAYVTLNGPAALINQVTQWPTDSIKSTGLNKVFYTRVNLAKVKTGNISVYPKIVQVHIPVEEFTEKTLRIPVKVIHNPNYYTVNVYPQWVNVTFTAPLSQYAAINESMFTAEADLQLWQQQAYSELPVKITKTPAYCKIVDVSPRSIDFIVKK